MFFANLIKNLIKSFAEDYLKNANGLGQQYTGLQNYHANGKEKLKIKDKKDVARK